MQKDKLKLRSAKSIVEYWASVERFTPPVVETENKIGYIKSIQKEASGVKDIPWQSRARFQHETTPNYTLVYTVFLGVIKCSDITTQMKELLKSSDEDIDLNSNGVSCLCSFQLNNYGEFLSETLTIPDYFISMSCLNQIDNYPKDWMSLAPKFNKKYKDIFDNQCDVIENRKHHAFTFDDLKEIQHDMIKSSGLTEFENLVSNTAVIYTSEVPVPNKFRQIKNREEAKKRFLDIDYYEEMLQEIVAPDYSILNSFYINDLDMVSNRISSKDLSISKSLSEYLNIEELKEKQDLRANIDLIEKYSSPSYIPCTKWPGNPQHHLSLAQQVAVNLALNSNEGLFSVNGPPGTGKSTLLRDIIAGVIFNRAEALSKFDNPCDAFKTSISISIERYNYRVWHLDESLLGHEMVIASTNNAAVENISKEIPRSSEVSLGYNIDYFSEIASHIAGEQAWGLGSAVLGNKTNRTKFFDNFWSKEPDPHDITDASYGLNYLLNKIKPKSDWTVCRDKFLATKEKFNHLIAELQEFQKAIIDLDFVQDEIDHIDTQKDKLTSEVKLLKEEIANHNNRLSSVKNSINSKNDQLKSVTLLKPAWYVVLVDFFLRRNSYKGWHTKCMDLIDEISLFSEEKEAIKSEIIESEVKINKLQEVWHELDKEQSKHGDRMCECSDIIYKMEGKYPFYSLTPFDGLWSLPDSKLQLTSPWIHEQLQEVRAELFADAMNLHKSFILNSSSHFSNNLRAIKHMVTSGSWPSEAYDLLPHIWATFFLVVPTISTTFASFASLFGNLDADTIGYLLVDEAGQSAPQVAAGAIYRSKRAIIVGDPMQIQPVVTIPRAINQALLDYYNVDKSWDVLEESVQTLTDRVNQYGTFLGRDNNSQWIGCPLRVHRRCMEPMFSVANGIAYDNLMIQATHNKPSMIEQIFPNSTWIDIRDGKFDGNWSGDEGEAAFKLLCQVIDYSNSLPSLYIISPFKQVAYNMKRYIKDNANKFSKSLNPRQNSSLFKWINKSVGTIHTFQGKQADMVIILLGGNPDRPGAINWASRYPNLLNVALTRAKNLVFVIGNHTIWSNKSYFNELAGELPVVSDYNISKSTTRQNAKQKYLEPMT